MITTEHDKAIEEATRKLVTGWDSIPQDWAKLVAEHIDGDEYVAMPMWGTLFKIGWDKGNISKLMGDIEAPDEYLSDATDEWKADNEGQEPDEDDLEEIADAAMEAWTDSGDDDAALASSGWQAVGDTGIIAREFDGHLMLGINGCGFKQSLPNSNMELGFNPVRRASASM